jgi:hypothetical protein
MAVFNILKGCYILDTLEDIARILNFLPVNSAHNMLIIDYIVKVTTF